MSRKSDKAHWGPDTKKRLALEAAKLIATESIPNYQQAKKKAAERLGIPTTRDLPSNKEVEEELRAYQGLFQQDSQPSALYTLRLIAVEAMLFFQLFKPKLWGAVLDGTANQHTSIELHAFAETSERFNIFLLDHNIPFEVLNRRYSFGHLEPETFPLFRFIVQETPIEVTVFPLIRIKQVPSLTPNGNIIQRININELNKLME